MKPKLSTRLIASLEPHRGLVTLLGTLILFLTFISRDVLREWARAERDKYDSAQASFDLNSRIVDLKDSIRHLEFLVLTEKPYSEDPNKQRHAHWEIDHERIEDLESLIEKVDGLRQTLPSGKANKEAADQLKSFSSRNEELSNRLGKAPPGDSVEASDQLMTDVFKEKSEIQTTGQAIVKSLKDESDSAEGWEHFFDGCSVALYTLGIVFTVTGQLLGVKMDASGS
jgi:hypothetical protein